VFRDPGGGRSGVEADAAVVPALHAAAEATEGGLLRLRRRGGLGAGSHHSQARSRRLHGACGGAGGDPGRRLVLPGQRRRREERQRRRGWFGLMGESSRAGTSEREDGGIIYWARRVACLGRGADLGRRWMGMEGGSEPEGDSGLFVEGGASIARRDCLLCRVTLLVLWAGAFGGDGLFVTLAWGPRRWSFPCVRARFYGRGAQVSCSA
jgi:hypothetical protein